MILLVIFKILSNLCSNSQHGNKVNRSKKVKKLIFTHVILDSELTKSSQHLSSLFLAEIITQYLQVNTTSDYRSKLLQGRQNKLSANESNRVEFRVKKHYFFFIKLTSKTS